MIRLPAVMLLAFGLALPAQAFDLNAMTAAERETFRAEVRSYLLENPEVLMEAIQILEQRQSDAQAANDETLVKVNADDLFRDGQSWVGGNPDGDITLVEFMDYRCGFCRRAFKEVEALVAGDGNIRFIVKEFPILGEQSVRASRFALATLQVSGSDAYKRVHDKLLTLRGNFTEGSLRALGNSLGLDTAAIMARMNAPEVEKVIADNHSLAERMQISGTPTFVIGTQMLRGYVPLDGMRQAVEQARAN